jgi:hypothetical protein
MDQPDSAHDLLVADRSMLEDPWLAAAELATAALAGTPPTQMKHAQRMLDKPGRFAPWHLAELASQVATTELRAGRIKRAKRLMRLALVEPTDNALAQAEWASANGLNIEPVSLDVPRTYEARALRYAHSGDWKASSRAGLHWLADQPFAQEPAQFTSYVASVGAEDWTTAEHAARIGLVSNPESQMLRNNLVFALANQHRVNDAQDELRLIARSDLGPRELAILSATQGLVDFRSGRTAEGRARYQEAVNSLARQRYVDLAALAQVFLAREEVLAGTAEAHRAVDSALELATSAGAPEARLWMERLTLTVAQRMPLIIERSDAGS